MREPARRIADLVGRASDALLGRRCGRRTLYSWDLKSAPQRTNFGETLGCVALRSKDTLLLGLESGLHAYEPSSRKLKLLSEFEPGLNTASNDGRVDRFGNFVIGSYNNAHRVDGQPIGGLWRLPRTAASSKKCWITSLDAATAFASTGRATTMFFCDTPTRKIYQFDYDERVGPSNRRLLYELPSSVSGGPDGAQCDAPTETCGPPSPRARDKSCASPPKASSTRSSSFRSRCPRPSPSAVHDSIPSSSPPEPKTAASTPVPSSPVEFARRRRGVPEPEYIDRTSLADAETLNPSVGRSSQTKTPAKFCGSCGAAFAKKSDRFCASCGAARG